MPMIDVYVPEGLLPENSERQLAEELTGALLRAEKAPSTPPFLHNTAAYIHVLPPASVHTAATAAATTVRIQILTPPGALNRRGQQAVVADATEIVARISGDPSQTERTCVLLQESAEGGWGIAGTAFGRDEFVALRG